MLESRENIDEEWEVSSIFESTCRDLRKVDWQWVVVPVVFMVVWRLLVNNKIFQYLQHSKQRGHNMGQKKARASTLMIERKVFTINACWIPTYQNESLGWWIRSGKSGQKCCGWLCYTSSRYYVLDGQRHYVSGSKGKVNVTLLSCELTFRTGEEQKRIFNSYMCVEKDNIGVHINMHLPKTREYNAIHIWRTVFFCTDLKTKK